MKIESDARSGAAWLLLLFASTLAAQVQPAPGWCAMAHCNNQMNDIVPLAPPGVGGNVYLKAHDTTHGGSYFGLGCVSNGKNAACSYNESLDALVYYDGDGSVLWTSGALLDTNTRSSAPIIGADGSVVVGDDQHIVKFSKTGKVLWSTVSAGGDPISLVTTPNGAIFSATNSASTNNCGQGHCLLAVGIDDAGSSYTTASVTLSGGDCPGASATATVTGGQISGITVTSQGTACVVPPDAIIEGDGSGAIANARLLTPGPISVYDGGSGALVGSIFLYASGNSGPFYETLNTPCGNGGSYPNRVYVSTNLSDNLNQGALWALDIDPANLTSPITPVWSVPFGGPSGASPLCIGNSVYFDGGGYQPGDGAGTTIFGVQDNGTSGAILFHQSLGAGTPPVNCNFAEDPRAIGGFWHEVEFDPNIYHRDATDGSVIETIDVSSLLVAAGAPMGTYWNQGVFTVLGAADHPYMVMPRTDIAYTASYAVMVDLTDGQLVWALPLYPANSLAESYAPVAAVAGSPDVLGPDDFPGMFSPIQDSTGQTVLVTTARYSGAYFIAEGAGTVSLSSAGLGFGSQDVGTSSASQTVTVINTSSLAITISGVTPSGDYTQSNNCTAPLAPGSTCAITVTFTPTAAGSRTGSLTVTDNATGSPQTVALSGMGVAAEPSISLSTASLRFTHQAVGTTSAAQTVTLTNSGKASLTITAIAATGEAVESSACPSLLPTQGTCTINVMFAPSGTGSRGGSVAIASNARNNPQAIVVNGIGTRTPDLAVGLSSTSLVFAAQSLGRAGVPQTVTLTNRGKAALTITNIAASGDAAQSNTCGPKLARAAECQIKVSFVPSATGLRTGTIAIMDNAFGSPQTIAVSGVGQDNPVPLLHQALAPAGQFPGAPGFRLNLLGGNFLPGVVVQWNGTALPTSFAGNTQVSATVPASVLATAGTALIRVMNPGPGGGPSNPIGFPVTTPSASQTLVRTDLAAGSVPKYLATADFNGDGKPDLAVTDATAGTVSILLGNGDGTFAKRIAYGAGADPAGIASGDFNGDGHMDLALVSQTGNTVSILLGNGDGTFATKKSFPTGNGPVALIAADLNGDGRLDLAVANRMANTVSILLGNGDGTFGPHLDYPAGDAPDALVVGDFNADGKLDLAVANDFAPGGTVSVLLGNGDGTFRAPVPYATGDSIALSVADINGDGKLDLAAANEFDQTLSVLLGNGDGTFQTAQQSGLPGRPAGMIVGDFNGDGTLSVAIAGNPANSVSILPGNGDGTFRQGIDYAVAAAPFGLVAADFNGDGNLDLAVADGTANMLSILLQAPAATLSANSLNFGTVAVGSSSRLTLTLANSGSAPLRIAGIGAGSPYSEVNNCPAALASGAVCGIAVTFAPTATGAQGGLLTVTGNLAAPVTVALAGAGN